MKSRIKAIRRAHDLTQAQFASMLNVDQTAVSNWEQGKNSIDVEIAKTIAKKFNVPLEFIYGGKYKITNPIENWYEDQIEDMKTGLSKICKLSL